MGRRMGWSAPQVWTNPPVQISGLSCVTIDFVDHIALGTLTRDGGSLCFSTMTQAGGSWTTPTPVHPLDDPTLGISCPHPGLSYWDGAFHTAATHYDSGAVTGAPKQHTELWTSPDFIHWHLEQMISATFENGSLWNAMGAGWAVSDAGRVILSQGATGAVDAECRRFRRRAPRRDPRAAFGCGDGDHHAVERSRASIPGQPARIRR